MDPEFNLARQMGIIPLPDVERQPDFSQYVEQEPTPDPWAPQPGPSVTDEDLLAHFVPGYVAQDPSAPQDPSSVPAGPLVGQKDQVSAGGKVSVSGRGFDPKTYSHLKGVDRERAIMDAQADADVEGVFGQTIDNMTLAKENEARAAQRVLEAQAEYDQEKAVKDAELAAESQKHTLEIEKANVMAQQEANEARARYQLSLADFAAQNVNPGRLWSNMSSADRVGVQAAAFVHDFLGARGIKTSAMDTLNRAIDRDIEAQVVNIQNKGKVADGFKNLWDMTIADSKSHVEALTKMRGYYLEDMKAQITAHMGSYESKVTQAKGQHAIAKLDQELAKNTFEVVKAQMEEIRARHAQNVQYLNAKLDAAARNYATSVQAQANRLSERKYNDERADKARAEQAAATQYLVPDISESGGGKMVAQIRPEFQQDKTVVRDVNERAQSAVTLSRKIREYKELLRTTDPASEFFRRERSNDDQKRLEALRLEILQAERKAITGAAMGKEEKPEYDTRIPLPTTFYAGGSKAVEKILSDFERRAIDSTQTYIRQYTTAIPEGDPRRNISVGDPSFMRGERTEAKAIGSGANEVKAQATDIATKTLTRPDRFADASDEFEETFKTKGKEWRPDSEWIEYNRERRKADPKQAVADDKAFDAVAKKNDTKPLTGRAEAPNFAVALYGLRTMAQDGNDKAAAQLSQWAGVDGGDTRVLPNGVDAYSDEGRLMRNFALYQYSQLSKATKPTLNAPYETGVKPRPRDSITVDLEQAGGKNRDEDLGITRPGRIGNF